VRHIIQVAGYAISLECSMPRGIARVLSLTLVMGLYASVVLFTVGALAQKKQSASSGTIKPRPPPPPETTQEAKSIKTVSKVAVGVPVIVIMLPDNVADLSQ
jgi:hypothetical protein